MERLTKLQIKKTDEYYMKCSETCPYDCEEICDCEEFDGFVNRLGSIEDILGADYDLNRLRELVEADLDGRCVVLPFPMHKMLFDMSDPIRPEILKDFRISATWDRCGIVFHSPWNIFLKNVEKGHIRIIHESVEAKLKGDPPC